MENMTNSTVTDWRMDLESGRAIAFPDIREIAQEDPAAAEVKEILEELRARNPDDQQFMIATNEGRYRGQWVNPRIVALRKIGKLPEGLESLGLHRAIVRKLTEEDLKQGGLVLVAGPPGSGKTTTAATTVRSRLVAHGGYCLAIEDPIEYDLAGRHGESGYCDQAEAAGPADYRNQVITALRKFPAKTPGMLFLGEVRDEVTATEAIKVGIAGFLTVTTLHSVGLIASIQRILGMMGGEESPQVRASLADALRLVIFQRWDVATNRVVAEMLPASELVRGAIKNGKFDAIKDEMHRVRISMQARN